MIVNRKGVTRTVFLVGRWAIKVTPGRTGFLRGWLANRSEWKQRTRPDVCAPVLTIGYFVNVYPRADEVGHDRLTRADAPEWLLGHFLSDEEWDATWESDEFGDDDGGRPRREEHKPSSLGRFGDRVLVIDFDRAWQTPRGWIGGVYYGRQERMARKWSRL